MIRRLPAWRVVLIAVLVVGLALRILVLVSPAYTIDSDVAIVTLMGWHVANGEFALFYWGQRYGGTALQFLIGAVTAATGRNDLVLPILEIALSLGAAVLLWWVVRRAVSERAGVVAAAVLWLPGFYLLRLSVVGVAFYSTSILFGLAAIAVTVAKAPWRRPAVAWLLIGLFGGLAFWSSPGGGAIAITALLPALMRGRATARSIAWIIPGGLVGAAPWIAGVLLGAGRTAEPFQDPFAFVVDRVMRLALDTIPDALVGEFGSHRLSAIVTLAVVAVFVAALVFGIRQKQWAAVAIVLSGAIVAVVLFLGGAYFTPAENRYVALMLPALAAAVAVVLGRWRWTSIVAVSALAAAAIASTAVGTSGFQVHRDRATVYGEDIAAVVDHLREEGIDRVWAGYWEAYRITASTGETIIAGDIPFGRYPPYVEAATGSSFVVLRSGGGNEALMEEQRQVEIVSRTQFGGLILYELAEPLDPQKLKLGVY